MIKNIIKKMFTFIKYICSSGISYIIDLLIFTILSKTLVKIPNLNYILIATVVARIISSFANFLINKNKVFNMKKQNNINLVLNYYLLVVIQMFMSAILVDSVYKLTQFNLVILKFLVDCVILLVNYFIQKKFIFNDKIIDFKNLAKKILVWIKENKLISIILLISLILHIAVLLTLGADYSLASDDASYIESGIYLKNNFTIIMHGVKSAQIMPGMTYLIALISYFAGEGLGLLICLKIVWMIMGVLSILGVYMIVRLFSNKTISSISSALLLAIDFIWMDNTILTETPFQLFFIFLIYASFKLADTKKTKYFYQIILFYFICVLLKANIAPYPIFLIIYLLLKKYDIKILGKQLLISIGILSIFFIPWIIRNYIVFNKFIPLTYGGGNPLLLGTYQGYDYPPDDEDAYNEYINENASEEMKGYLNDTKNEKPYMKKYYSLEKDGLIAKYRMKEWWKNNKLSMIKSYLIYKPYINIYNTFYWREIWNIPSTLILKIRAIDIVLTIICSIVILINKRNAKELVFLVINYVFQILVYSYTFAFDRYGQTILFIRFIIIGMGLQIIYNFVKNKIVTKKIGKKKLLKD